MIKKAFFSFIVCLGCVSFKTNAICSGNIPNPITDVCWACVFPMNIAGVELWMGQRRNYDPPPPPVCSCPLPPPIYQRIGFGLSFWEMSRFVEVVRHPFCSPTLGGISIMPPGLLPSGGNERSDTDGTGYAHYQVHIFTAPIMGWVGANIGAGLCLSPGSNLDVMFMSELMFNWNDDSTSLLLNPEALLFANPASILACAADAVPASTAGFGIDPLFWCSGAQGTVYPLNGNRPGHFGALDSAINQMHKGMFMNHRLLVEWDTSTPAAMCGAYIQPMMRKNQYKYNIMHPVGMPAMGHGFGSSTWWGAGQEFPYQGEDYSFLLFRKRSCCAL